MQRLKDLEERRIVDRQLAELELQMVEKAIKDYPELAEKVKVIRRDHEQVLTEKQLLEFLRDSCKESDLKNMIEEDYQQFIKSHKKKRIRVRRRKNKKNDSKTNELD